MLVRNVHLVRRSYLATLNFLSRFIYGPGVDPAAKPTPSPGQLQRLRRINSELEYGPAALYVDSDEDADVHVDTRQHLARSRTLAANFFTELAGATTDAVDAINGDSLTRCFVSEPPELWNFMTRTAPSAGIPPLLIPLWLASVWIRWCVLLPVRIGIVIVVALYFFPLFGLGAYLGAPKVVMKWLMQCLASGVCASWGGLIRYHGQRPTAGTNKVYVANHTSMIDAVLLYKDYPLAIVAQRHGGLAGFIEDLLEAAQAHVWFDREVGRDRKRVLELLRRHVDTPGNEPVLVFPEGTCVNNEYCILFKKGSFEIGATVYPVAIRYNKNYADGYWNSSTTPFSRHLLDLMTSWAVVADVYYLPPQTMQPGENAAQFAGRVKELICEAAGLASVNWDGFLKRHRISPKFLEQRQRAFAAVLQSRISRQPMLRGSFSSSVLFRPGKPPAGTVPPLTTPANGGGTGTDTASSTTTTAASRTGTPMGGLARMAALGRDEREDLIAHISNRIYLLLAALAVVSLAVAVPLWGVVSPGTRAAVLGDWPERVFGDWSEQGFRGRVEL